jgi:hypothetical protein
MSMYEVIVVKSFYKCAAGKMLQSQYNTTLYNIVQHQQYLASDTLVGVFACQRGDTGSCLQARTSRQGAFLVKMHYATGLTVSTMLQA